MGDYTYPIDNHKNDSINLTRNAAISTGKKYYHKHVGSKPFSKLIKILHDFCTVKKDIFEIIAEKKKKKSA